MFSTLRRAPIWVPALAMLAMVSCERRKTRAPEPAPFELRWEEMTALPTYVTNNAVATVRDSAGTTYLVTATGLGPAKAQPAITNEAWALALDVPEAKWLALPSVRGGKRIGASLVELGDAAYLVGGFTVTGDDEEATLASIEFLTIEGTAPPAAPPSPPKVDEAPAAETADAAVPADAEPDAEGPVGEDADEASDPDEASDTDETSPDDDADSANEESDDPEVDPPPKSSPAREPPPAATLTAKWAELGDSPTPTPVDDTVAVAWRDHVVLVSGWSDDDNVPAVQLFDTKAKTWLEGTPIPGTPVFGHAGAMVDDVLVYCDGVRRRSEDELDDDPDDDPVKYAMVQGCWEGRFDAGAPGTIEWKELPPHPGPARYRMAAGALGPYIIFVGGSARAYNYDGIGYDEEPAQPESEVFAWDTRANRWWTLGQAPLATMDHRSLAQVTSASGDTALYLVGGMVGDQAVSSRVFRITLQ